MDVTIILVNYRTAHLLKGALERVERAAQALSVQTIVVDNASNDGSVELVRREFPGCELIANAANVGFGRANNQALALARGRYVLLLNTDAFVAPDTLQKTVAYMDAHPRCGILGVRLVDPNGVLQPSARYFPTPWNLFLARTGLQRIVPGARMVDDMAWDHGSVRHCDWVPGCYYLVRRTLIDEIGLFDPRYFLYYEEVDHCRSAKRAGWEVVFYPGTTVVHIGGESAKSEGELTAGARQLEPLQIESELLYFRKNHGIASVWLDVALTALGDAFTIFKRLARRKRPLAARSHLRHAALVCSLFRQTAWGTRPTR
jgi:N-acetylglucosaminyl-diphospho-decaprenol L-rhamnosyltransferase